MSLPSPGDTNVPPFTAVGSAFSLPPISIPFRFKPKRSLSPTAHDTHPHHYPSPADSPIQPPTNANATTFCRAKRKRSLSLAEPPVPDHPHPTDTPASPPQTIKRIRFKRGHGRGRGASYRPNYPTVPTADDAANHRRSPSPLINDDPPAEKPSKSTSSAKPPKCHRPAKQPKSRRRRHPSPHLPDKDGRHTQWDAKFDADTAFRESLFDAMADDEGAAFWEQVYGQPIHTYSAYYPTTAAGTGDPHDDPDNKQPRLEKMTEEEYVRYVRGKMYEKSHGYIFEERAKREAGKKAAREQEKRRKRWDSGVEEALRRGEERMKAGKWKGVWEGYVGAWNVAGEGVKGEERYADGIRWPVRSGQRRDVGREEIKKFFDHAPQSGSGGVGNVDMVEVLKKERVRWHPDKMQQRAGEGGLDIETTKLVTAVFQIIDRLWSEKKGGD